MKIQAMSKVNLALDVLRKREDGYHEVRMVMQTLQLHDELSITKRKDDRIVINCTDSSIECDENNLIYKAAKLLMESSGVWSGLDIFLIKNIPVAAGMAGGSTDAAAILIAVNELLGLKKNVEELKEIGVKIGADVPYCIEGGTQLSEGIGEKLKKLPSVPDSFVVVLKPHISVSTKYVYENLHVDTIEHHPNVDNMLEAISEGSIAGIAASMENILENVTEKKYPVISKLKNILKENGADNAIMSGSGPTVFGLFSNESVAKEALNQALSTGDVSQGFVTTFAAGSGIIVQETDLL